MKPKLSEAPLHTLIQRLTRDAIAFQRTLDAAFLRDLQQGEIPAANGLLPGLPHQAAPLLRMQTFEVKARVQWRAQKTAQAFLGLSLLNPSADLRYQCETSGDSRFTVAVAALRALAGSVGSQTFW